MSFRLAPTARKLGVEIEAPSEVEIHPGDGDTLVRCSEARPDGKPVGELEISVFQAALVIDRDGALEEVAQTAASEVGGRVQAAVPVELPGASGYRADIERAHPPLPYGHVFAIAPHDLGIQSGLLVTVRCATPEWPAADAILESIRILTRRGRTANDGDVRSALPIIGQKPSGGRSDS